MEISTLFVWFNVYRFASETTDYYNKKYKTAESKSYAKVVSKGIAIYGNTSQIEDVKKYISSKEWKGVDFGDFSENKIIPYF